MVIIANQKQKIKLLKNLKRLCHGFIIDWSDIDDDLLLGWATTKNLQNILDGELFGQNWITLSWEKQKNILSKYRYLRDRIVRKVKKYRAEQNQQKINNMQLIAKSNSMKAKQKINVALEEFYGNIE